MLIPFILFDMPLIPFGEDMSEGVAITITVIPWILILIGLCFPVSMVVAEDKEKIARCLHSLTMQTAQSLNLQKV